MDQNKIIIIALITIIAILLVGIAAVMPNLNKKDTNLDFKSKSTLSEGDYLKIKLTDVNGNAIANQTLNITLTGSDESSESHPVITNANGNGKLKINNLPGKYEINVVYLGNDDYNGINATKNITVKENVVQAQTTVDSGAFYSAQAGRVIYTGEVHDAPDGHKWKHLGNNEWVKID